jgi:nucleotide-binding universal stress UspA family protein
MSRIVMGRQGRHALEQLMLGSTTRKVLAECSADVLLSIHRTAKP